MLRGVGEESLLFGDNSVESSVSGSEHFQRLVHLWMEMKAVQWRSWERRVSTFSRRKAESP